MGKWWSWVPGLHKTALKNCRLEALSNITGERLYVERMAQRPRPEADVLDVRLRDEVLKKISDIYDAAGKINDIDEIDDLTDDAELEGLFAAYLCPAAEIRIEGDLVIDQIEGWASRNLRSTQCVGFGKKLPITLKCNLKKHGGHYTLFLRKGTHGEITLTITTKQRIGRCSCSSS
jgi:hypothetical protein